MTTDIQHRAKTDLFEAPDYYVLDDLLTEEHLLVREAARAWVKKEVTPIIEQYNDCLLYTSPSPRDQRGSRMPSSA